MNWYIDKQHKNNVKINTHNIVGYTNEDCIYRNYTDRKELKQIGTITTNGARTISRTDKVE